MLASWFGWFKTLVSCNLEMCASFGFRFNIVEITKKNWMVGPGPFGSGQVEPPGISTIHTQKKTSFTSLARNNII